MTTTLKPDVLARVGMDIIYDIYANEKITERGNELRIKDNGSIVYDKQTTRWYDHVNGEGGNAITLYARKYGLTTREAYRLIADKYGDSTFAYQPLTIVQEDKQPKIDKADEMWQSSCFGLDTGVETYLNNRGIQSKVIPKWFKCYRSDKPIETDNLIVPIVRVIDNELQLTGVQITYLDEFSNKRNGKSKFSYGVIKGSAVHLTPYEDLTDTLCLVEGIEDGLSVIQFNEGISVWAYLGATNLKNVVIPEGISEIVLIKDNDIASDNSANEFILKHGNKYSIKELRPPESFKDFNQYLMEGL
jgi:hypothetical protein|tara:strand:- start:2519 stop:3427 length:909 start_codon:yes stop_codon:yes gene_type:complete